MQTLIEQLRQDAEKANVRKEIARSNVTQTPATGAGRWFGFFVESLSGLLEGRPRETHSKPRSERLWLQCADSTTCYLVAEAGGPPRMTSDRPPRGSRFVALEPLRQQDGRSRLIMRQDGAQARINGLPAPCIAVLRRGDQLQIDDEHLLHVALYVRPYFGEPTAEHVGQKCPFCKSAIQAGQRIYLCPHCGTAMHCQEDEVAERDRLRCAMLATECRHCAAAVVMKEGFSDVPEH